MHDARSAYFETQILTAAPQKLRLLLIEGCLRLVRQARDAQAAGNGEQFSLSMERARDIVTELISGIRPDRLPINETARALYAFLFKSLAEAQLLSDAQKIDDALRVLEEERQTWLQVCDLSPEIPLHDEPGNFRQQEVLSGGLKLTSSLVASGFSLDA